MRKANLEINLPRRLAVLLPLLLLLLPILWSRPATGGANFTLQAFDVGQGDSSLMQCGRTQALIDGGPDRTVLARLGRSMPFTDTTIEYVFLTHPHDDHLFGLFAVLERYEVGALVVSEYVEELELGRELVDLADELEVPVVTARSGDTFAVGDCGRLEVLWPVAGADRLTRGSRDEVNDRSLVLQLDGADGEPQALLTGDAGTTVEDWLVENGRLEPIRILKVGHHGSRYSTETDFLRAVDPDEAVIPVGENAYGHPARIILDRLDVFGIQTWRTDHDGTAIFDLDPEPSE
ncbi:MAG: MBL fold metallo-hydrolase [bacterium]